MTFKETFTSTKEAEIEAQNTITFLKEYGFLDTKYVQEGKYIKSYKKELEIEGQLRRLSDFMDQLKHEAKAELKAFKASISAECLKIKCRQVENELKAKFSDDEEDYGDDD